MGLYVVGCLLCVGLIRSWVFAGVVGVILGRWGMGWYGLMGWRVVGCMGYRGWCFAFQDMGWHVVGRLLEYCGWCLTGYWVGIKVGM
jgi:hypothetical protein